MIAETKKRVSQLVEINRALAHDLDISRRDAARLARENEGLLEEVARLRREGGGVVSGNEVEETTRRAETVRHDPTEPESAAEDMRCEITVLLADCEAARARAYRAEEEMRALGERLRRVEEERDEAVLELDDSMSAMEGIRDRLAGSLHDSRPW